MRRPALRLKLREKSREPQCLSAKEVAMWRRNELTHDDDDRSGLWDRDGDAFWILYAVIGWAVAYLLYLSSSTSFQLGL